MNAPLSPDDLERQQQLWIDLDHYVNAACLARDQQLLSHLDAAIRDSERAGLPHIQVSAAMGKHLNLLARLLRASRILEIGTLGGYSAIWLADALPSTGALVTLELEQRHADVARRNLHRAGLSDRTDIRVGPALDALDQLIAESAEPFDLVFIDADKENIPDYLDRSLRLARPGAAIIVDNVIRDGRVLDAESDDPSVQGVRHMFERLKADRRLAAAAVQTVGEKGHDGFLLALVSDH